MTVELKLIIEAIKCVLFGKNIVDFRSLFHQSTIDYNRLARLLEYHAVRPIFFNALNLAGLKDNSIFNKLKNFYLYQIQANHNSELILRSLNHLFEENEITIIPYKGSLFRNSFYPKNLLRESVDLDIIIKEEDAVEGLSLLFKNGYFLDPEKYDYTSYDPEQLITLQPNKELCLIKAGTHLKVDYHWSVQAPNSFNFLDSDFFNDCQREENRGIRLPSPTSLFKMILIHHGGRDHWIRLKHLVDLFLFQKYSNYEKSELFSLASEMNAKSYLRTGYSLIDEFFLEKSNEPSKLNNLILKSWETALPMTKIDQKVIFARIKKNMAFPLVNWHQFIKKEISFHALKSPAVNNFLFYKHQGSPTINAFGKLLYYLFKDKR